MHYVILRDDDTNALTPPSCLDRLYQPFLDRGLPVNLAIIPQVATDVTMCDGRPEGYLLARDGATPSVASISANQPLVQYLSERPGYRVVQHGFQHVFHEFDHDNRSSIRFGLEEGSKLLEEAGFPRPRTFVAPYDKLSRTSLEEVARRFDVVSTGWFELGRLPVSWWPQYLVKRMRQTPHWRVGQSFLLSHPGCLLSYQRPRETMLDAVKQSVLSRRLTVLVTHWWEYFRDNTQDERLIQILHDTARFLAGNPQIRVISFDDLAEGRVTLN